PAHPTMRTTPTTPGLCATTIADPFHHRGLAVEPSAQRPTVTEGSRRGVVWSTARSARRRPKGHPSRSGQAEDALGDDGALDLGGAAGDGAGEGADEAFEPAGGGVLEAERAVAGGDAGMVESGRAG